MKRILLGTALVVSFAVAFLMGYGGAAKAWPVLPDRDAWYGYFYNVRDTMGDDVFAGGIPGWVDSADEFIGFIENNLYNGDGRHSVGAAFIIQTMMPDRYSRNYWPSHEEMIDWESRIRWAESNGWINWGTNFSYIANSYWQGNYGGGSEPNDNAFYWEADTRWSIVFMSRWGVAYVIKRDCANPLGQNGMVGLDWRWDATGRTTASVPQAVPGETVTFRHYVRNAGPTTAKIWWAVEATSPAPAGIASGGPDLYLSGEEINVRNENFTIPNNAAAGTQYCQRVGWDPVNSYGGRDGRGPPACVTVYIPAKIKAVMSVSPSNIIVGESATFTPGITVQSAGNPVIVNCTISRVLTPPSGPAQNLGNPACVDTSGNPNITVSGGGTTLRANSYTAPDTVAVGSRICDTITITNPAQNIFYNNPAADRTATTCVVVAKTPYSRFMGNDVFAGGNFAAVNAACNNQAKITTVGRTLSDGSGAGSVVEYAAFALNRITGFGSSSRVLVGSGALGAAARQLTFANSEPDATRLGYFGKPQHCINDYTTNYAAAPTLAPGSYNVGSRGSGAWRVNGALTLSGTMPAGGQQVYYATGNVTINSNLVYPATYANSAAIPSLVVITTGNIQVGPGVTQLDGIFIARGDGNTSGVFYTCFPRTEPASVSNACNTSALTVNGAVSAGRIDLFRSFGATGASAAARKAPAEQFYFSPEIYIRNALSASAKPTIQTSTVLDLPPRF